MSVLDIFKAIGRAVKRALTFAQASGLTDALVQLALTFVTQAAQSFVDNAAKREWVVAQLVARHVPESIARLAVELAVQLYKKEVPATPPAA